MCGIVGMIYPEGKGTVSAPLLRSMNQALFHRGPDDEGYHLESEIGLGMRRLRIIDLESGQQPMANETGEVWTVFNGEIYNYRELREWLIHRGHRLKTQSDTEVIVHLYEEYGENFVQKLRGMFAIALWDKRRRELFLFRDRLGIKPLHYWFQQGVLVFSSEIKALLKHPDISRELSLEALSDYLSFLYIPEPDTIYRDIKKLEPGHFLRWRGGELEVRSYWDLNFQERPWVGETEWVRRLQEEIEESVRLHSISDVPLGAFLSGGLDSSTVVAWMARQNQGAVKTYSIGFHDAAFNELPYAREVARRFQTDHHEALVDLEAAQLLPRIVSSFDEPFGDSSAIPTYRVCEFARKEVTVALSGDGGDELFGGYLWTWKELWLQKYRSLPSWLRRGMESVYLKNGRHPRRESSVVSLFQRFFYDASLEPSASFARRSMCFQPWMKQELFQPWLCEALSGHDSVNRVRDLFGRKNAASVLDKLLYLDTKIYLPGDLLTKVDRMSMAHSLEVRVPLLDHKIAELVASIPFSYKQRGRATKYILKKTMEGLLPPAILKQRKQGFSVPLGRWFREDLGDLSRRMFTEKESAVRRYFSPDYLEWLYQEHRAGRQRFGPQLYALLVFELWHRTVYQSGGEPQQVLLKDLVS